MRPVVSIMRSAGRTAARHLSAGQRLRFGACGCGACRFGLVVPVGPAGPVIGTVSARRDHWRLDNLGRPALIVVDLEHPRSLITVPGGRVGAVVPFELAQIHDGEQPLVTVFGPEPAAGGGVAPLCPAVREYPPTGGLDPGATYFAVLVALCEPRLRRLARAAGPDNSTGLPTSPEIVRILAGRGIAITSRAVDAHIEYLVDKLGLRPAGPTAAAGRARRGWRKEAVAAAALRRRLVRPEHVPISTTQPRGCRPVATPGRAAAPAGDKVPG